MKQLIREYQGIIISSFTAMFTLLCIIGTLPNLSKRMNNKIYRNQELIYDTSVGYKSLAKFEYLMTNRILLYKDSNFLVNDYLYIEDCNFGRVDNFDYELYVDGKKVEYFKTDKCGAFVIDVISFYRGITIEANLFVSIEERG